MFAHYNQHYQQGGGTAVSTNGMVWNGNAWVAGADQHHGGAGNAGRHSTYSTGAYGAHHQQQASSQQQQQQQQQQHQQPQELSSLVTKYTQYYHQWTARAKEHEQHVQRLPLNSAERAQAQSHVDWSKYYADQASRAAHHYHSTPHQPAPFELPPAPPEGQQQHVQQAQAHQTAVAAQKQPAFSTPSARKGSRWDEVSSASKNGAHTRNPESSSSSSNGPPDGLKRYVHRCLEQCKTPEQTKAVEKETERVIAKALETGTLHNKNWDIEPLIALPGMSNKKKKRGGEAASPPSSSSRQYNENQSSKKQKLTSNDSYYGPSSGATSQPSASSWDSGDQGGYYGSSNSSSHTAPQTSYHHQQQQQQSKYQMGHYGPTAGDGNEDFIAVPQFGKKNGKKGSNKYVNPNSTKHINQNKNDGFKRNSDTLAKRANRFSGPGGNADVRQFTAKGIEDRYLGKGVIGGSSKQLDENDYEHMKVKGTCTKLEKQYLRLTAPPKAELVRPLHILQQHLKNLKEEWKSPQKRDYLWFCSEMKSMRQDLTVQHISNGFTIETYEFHARIALQEGDLNEFNQAQTQLRILYKTVEDPKALENENEFVAYLLIYFVMLSLNKKYTGGSSDILKLMLSLTPAQREDPAIQHALQLRAAVADIDYHKFFHRLYPECPNLGSKLMDLMVPTVRHWALQRIVRAFRPSISLVYVLKELGMKADSPEEIEEGRAFLVSCGCVLTGEGSESEIQAKDSVVRESDLQEKRSLI